MSDKEEINYLKVFLGPVLGFIAYLLLLFNTQDEMIAKTAAVIVWMAVWWMTEAVSIYFTALLPAFMFPFLGIMSMEKVSDEYMNPVIFLFIGGFLLAFAFEKSNLHTRIALKIILLAGATLPRVVFGVMAASYILSMWISNTASTMLLVPSVTAIISQFNEGENINKNISTPLLLGLAFAATIGGIATIVGSPPNLILLKIYNSAFPDLVQITFSNWMMVGFPLSMVFLFICYFLLKLLYFKNLDQSIDLKDCKSQYKELGKPGRDEIVVQVVFYSLVFLWFFLRDISIGDFFIPGWTSIFEYEDFITEGTVALLMVSLFFIIPSEDPEKPAILIWEDAKKLPIGILFLFGGGFTIAEAMGVSGLSDFLATQLKVLDDLSVALMIIIISALVVFLSGVATNTAIVLLFLPIIISLSRGIDIHPLLLMFPASLAASLSFMLPVATPPNTIVFATEKLNIKEMVKSGTILNFIAVGLITATILTLGRVVFGF